MQLFQNVKECFGFGKPKPSPKTTKPKNLTPAQRTEKQRALSKLEQTVIGWGRIIKLIAFPFFFLSAWLTTKGLFDSKIEAHAANTEGMITAAMTAIVAAVMIGGANMLLFSLASHASKKQRWQVIGLVCCISAVSRSYLNV